MMDCVFGSFITIMTKLAYLIWTLHITLLAVGLGHCSVVGIFILHMKYGYLMLSSNIIDIKVFMHHYMLVRM